MSSRKYELGACDEMRAQHRWEVPERYNITQDICSEREPDRLAMVWEGLAGDRARA